MDASLHFQEFGQGLPVLLIHGWELSSVSEQSDFEPVLSKIPGLRRICVDLPGMGKSPANNAQNLDDMYDRLVAFIDAHIGKERFLISGSSAGGHIARGIAQKYKDQADGLLLRVPAVETDNSKRDLDPFEPLITDSNVTGSLSPADTTLLQGIAIQTAAYIKLFKQKVEQVYRPAESSADMATLNTIRSDTSKYKLSFSTDTVFPAPTLILCGKQDVVTGYRDPYRVLQYYPRATFAALDRATHDLPVDEAENALFAALVKDWIFRVEEWRAAHKQA